MERLSHSPGLPVASEKSALSKAGSGPSAEHWDVFPALVETLARASCLELDRWKQCPRSPSGLH